MGLGLLFNLGFFVQLGFFMESCVSFLHFLLSITCIYCLLLGIVSDVSVK